MLGICAFGLSQIASANDITFIPRISAGVLDYSLKWKGDFGLGDETILDISDTMPTIAIGGTATMGAFYLDAYWQTTGDGSDDYSFLRNDGSRFDGSSDFDRDDYALSLGYGFENGITVFGGYKGGKTDIDSDETFTRNDGTPGGFFHRINDSFEARGPFIGIGYGIRLGPGLLSATAALARLDGEAKEETVSTRTSDGSLSSVTRTESKPSATGLSLGIAWRAPITDNLSYMVSLDGQRYNFDQENLSGTRTLADGTVESVATVPLKVEEEIVNLRATISYRF
jgi:hypothetical protein